MTYPLDELHDSLQRLQDLHTLHVATGYCVECHNPWPCDSQTFVSKAADAFHYHVEVGHDMPPAVELGKVLSNVESRLGLEGSRAEKVISALHHLVLEQGLVVTGYYGPFSAYEVAVAVDDDTVRPLWRLVLNQHVLIEIFAPTGKAVNKRFLSQVLMESFSPRDATQIVSWWDTNDDSGLRAVSVRYDDPVSTTKAILMLVEATIRFNNNLRIELHKDQGSSV
jgi:hypothetical protein